MRYTRYKKEDLGEYLRHGDLNKDWPSNCEVVIESFKKLREIENKIDAKRLSIIDEKMLHMKTKDVENK